MSALKTSALILFFVSLVMIDVVIGQANCPNQDDYSPCTCSGTTASPKILCTGASMSAVASVFARTKAVDALIEIDLRPTEADVAGIPANILGNKRAGIVSIRCPAPTFQLRIDVNAFRFSQNDMNRILIQYCDLTLLSLAFLENFESLNYLGLASSSNVQRAMVSMRAMPALESLSLYNSKGLNEPNWVYPNRLVNGLVEVDCGANGLEDAAIDRLMSWLSLSSTNSLQVAYFDSNSLTKVPSILGNFFKLNAIDFSYNQITALPRGSLTFTANVLRVNLAGNQISYIAPGAFDGNFHNARVQVQTNKLTRFEASVFEEILLQMAKPGSVGSLFASGNQYDCSSDICHLAWLVDNDRHRDLLAKLDLISCSSGVRISNIPQLEVEDCPFECAYDGPQQVAPCSSEFYTCSYYTPYLFNCTPPDVLKFNKFEGTCDYANNIPACRNGYANLEK